MENSGVIRKAVIPAAGFGTRMLPAAKSVPKEMLPVLDRPTIQYVVEEAAEAGVDDVLLVTSREKKAVEDHFDRSPELEQRLPPPPEGGGEGAAEGLGRGGEPGPPARRRRAVPVPSGGHDLQHPGAHAVTTRGRNITH